MTARGIRLVGTENPDIEDSPDNCFEVHHILLGNSIPVVENLFLKNVSEGKYIFYCFPLNVYGADACPVRAILEPLDNSL